MFSLLFIGVFLLVQDLQRDLLWFRHGACSTPPGQQKNHERETVHVFIRVLYIALKHFILNSHGLWDIKKQMAYQFSDPCFFRDIPARYLPAIALPSCKSSNLFIPKSVN